MLCGNTMGLTETPAEIYKVLKEGSSSGAVVSGNRGSGSWVDRGCKEQTEGPRSGREVNGVDDS